MAGQLKAPSVVITHPIVPVSTFHGLASAAAAAKPATDAVFTQNYSVQTGAAPNVETTPQMQSVALTGLSVAPGEQLLLWSDAVLGQVGASNPGGAKSFKVAVSTMDPTTGKTTATQTVAGSVAANADFAVTIGNWNQLSNAPSTKQGAFRGLLPANFQMPTVQ